MSNLWRNENLNKLAYFLADNIDINIFLTCYDTQDYLYSLLEEYREDLLKFNIKTKND